MRAPLSVIIPTLNSTAVLGPTATSLMEGVDAGIVRELVISDGGSSDAIARVAEELGSVFVEGRRGRGIQLAAGARAAHGKWMLFIHADTQVGPGWSSVVSSHMSSQPGLAGYFKLRFQSAGVAPRFVAAWANFRSKRLGLPYGDQGLLISRDHYDRIGGYSDIPLMEDVEIVRRLEGRMRMLDCDALTSASRYLEEGWFRRGSRNLSTLAKYLLGASPESLVKGYERS